MSRLFTTPLAALLVLCACDFALAADSPPLKALLIDGQNNHDWRSTTPPIKSALERTGPFAVTVATLQPKGPVPTFADYAVVVSNFTDFGAAPGDTKLLDALTRYVRDGGAFVAVHAATSGMDHYPEYPRMVGMGWRDGDRLFLDDTGKTVRQKMGQGPPTWHGALARWPVTIQADDHPICAGLPKIWPHDTDELWEAPRGPAQDVEILATAVGFQTKQNEPVLWTVRYGKGRVFVTLLGHDAAAMKCPGFQTTLARGCEWAATGKVTQPLPANFPSKDKPAPASAPAGFALPHALQSLSASRTVFNSRATTRYLAPGGAVP